MTKIGRSSFTLAYPVWSAQEQAEVATGEDVIVVMGYRAGRTTPVDAALRAAVASVEGSAPRRPATSQA